MSPIPPVKPGEMHDRRGVPIYPGDLVRSWHFDERLRNGKKRTHYLYHVIVETDGDLEMVPASWLAKPNNGGRCWLKIVDPTSLTVIDGYGPVSGWAHQDRPRKRTAARPTQQP